MKIKIAFTLAVVVLLTGCHQLTVKGFNNYALSAIKENKSELMFDSKKTLLDPDNGELTRKAPNFVDAIKKYCAVKDQKSGIEVALVPVIGKLLYDLSMDYKTNELKKLKKAATYTYSNSLTMKTDDFSDADCIVLYRYTSDPNAFSDKNQCKDDSEKCKGLGLASVLKINKYETGFTLSPVFVRAHNTAAITKKPVKDENAKINVSYAISLKAIGKDKSGMPELISFGKGVMSVVNVRVGPAVQASCTENDCDSSDLIPYLGRDATPMTVTLAVTETGKLGVDIDEKLAEYATIKEAIGPAIKEALTKE